MLGSFMKCRSLIRLVRPLFGQHDILGVKLPAKYYLWIEYPSPITTADNQDVLGRIIIWGIEQEICKSGFSNLLSAQINSVAIGNSQANGVG